MVSKLGDKKVIVSPIFIVSVIAIATAMLSFFIYKITVTAAPYDPQPKIEIITPKQIAQQALIPPIVRTGLQIKNFRKFDLVKNEFIFEGTVWFDFDPSVISLDSVSNFTFEKGEIIEKMAPESRLQDTGRLFTKFDIRVKFSSDMDYSLFPFDDHTIYLILVARHATPNDFVFESTPREFVVEHDVTSLGWKEYDRLVRTGADVQRFDLFSNKTDVIHPCVEYSIKYQRSGVRYGLTIILPMLVLFFVVMFAFTLDPERYRTGILAFCTAAISALLAFRFVIENMSPLTGGYFLVSDYLFIIFLLLSIAVFLFSMFAEHVGALYKKLFIVLLNSIIVGYIGYIWIMWVL